MITGRNEEMPGKPLVYATSKTFMDYFGLNSADELPKLKEIFADAMVQPTVIQRSIRLPEDRTNDDQQNNEPGEENETNSFLAVSETGELIEDANDPNNDSSEHPGE